MASVLIFGGASGIGAATAARFEKEGWNALVADIKFGTQGRNNFHCDVTKTSNIEHAFDWAGPLTAVVYCAGMQSAMVATDNERYPVADLFNVNTFGAIDAMRAYAQRHTHGSATLVASVAGLTSGGPGLSAYGAAKAAVIGFTKSMSLELAPHFRVNCVCPGWTDTPFNQPVIDHMGGRQFLDKQVAETVPLQRQASPVEIASAIYFITSEQASYITGHTLVVDGGLTV